MKTGTVNETPSEIYMPHEKKGKILLMNFG